MQILRIFSLRRRLISAHSFFDICAFKVENNCVYYFGGFARKMGNSSIHMEPPSYIPLQAAKKYPGELKTMTIRAKCVIASWNRDIPRLYPNGIYENPANPSIRYSVCDLSWHNEMDHFIRIWDHGDKHIRIDPYIWHSIDVGCEYDMHIYEWPDRLSNKLYLNTIHYHGKKLTKLAFGDEIRYITSMNDTRQRYARYLLSKYILNELTDLVLQFAFGWLPK